MSAAMQEPRTVPVDVLPPLPKNSSTTQLPPVPEGGTPPLAGFRSFYHPASGVVILGLDLLIFGPEMLADFFSGLMALPFLCVLSFVVTFPIVFLIQKKWSKDTTATALGKAFIGAFAVGLPFPVTGTMLGAAILALSGLPHHPVEMVKKLLSPQK